VDHRYGDTFQGERDRKRTRSETGNRESDPEKTGAPYHRGCFLAARRQEISAREEVRISIGTRVSTRLSTCSASSGHPRRGTLAHGSTRGWKSVDASPFLLPRLARSEKTLVQPRGSERRSLDISTPARTRRRSVVGFSLGTPGKPRFERSLESPRAWLYKGWV